MSSVSRLLLLAASTALLPLSGCGPTAPPAVIAPPAGPQKVEVEVVFSTMAVIDDREDGSGDWRITLSVDGRPLGEPIKGEAGTGGAVNLSQRMRSRGLAASHQVMVTAKVEEWDGGFDSTWEFIGEETLTFGPDQRFGVGSHTIDFDDPEGKVSIKFLIAQREVGSDPLPAPVPQPTPTPTPTPTVPNATPKPAPARVSRGNQLPEPEATPKPGHVYRHLWSKKPNGGWAHAAVIVPSGDLASVSRGILTVHARDDGRILEQAPICNAEGPRAMRMDGGKLYIACSKKVVEVSVPGLEHRDVLTGVLASSSGLFREAAFGGDRVVYAHNDGLIEVYSTKTWKKVASHTIDKKSFAPKVAVSATGRSFVAADSDYRTFLFRGQQQVLLKEMSNVMTFDPTGQRVFGGKGTFGAAELTLTSRKTRGEVRTGSWITEAIYMGPNKVALAGSDGLSVVDLKTGAAEVLTKLTAESIAVSKDGNLICGADRGDRVTCFGRGAIAPSTYKTP